MLGRLSQLSNKAKVLMLDRQHATDRVSHKLATWFDRSVPASTLLSVGSASDLDYIVAEFISTDQPLTGSAASLLEGQIETTRLGFSDGPFPIDGQHNGTVTLGRLCYLFSRYLRPRRVVETGVAYGVTSSYILLALAQLGRGELHSIDLPPLVVGAENYVGYFVPRELRARWKLHIGSAKRLLPGVLRDVGTIDLFVHDSLHTYSHMKWEFETALCSLRPGGVLISDDIEGNRAFEEITRHPSVASWFAIRQEGKDAICGVLRTKG